MPDAGFQKVTRSDTRLHGPRKLLLCGFGAGAQEKFKTVLHMANLSDVPVVWAGSHQADMRVGALMDLPGNNGSGQDSDLVRAVIMGGLKERELHTLMGVSKKAGMKDTLWAALTPTSETWTLSALLAELSAERASLEKNRTPRTKPSP